MTISLAQKIVNKAASYNGQHEEPPHSNAGAFVVACFTYTWLKFRQIPRGKAYWCVAFVQMVFAKCGLKLPWGTAGAYDLYARGKAAGWAVAIPKMGDIGIWNIGDGHANVVNGYNAKTRVVTTWDGNVSDRVGLHHYSINQARGFLRHPSLRAKPKPVIPPKKKPKQAKQPLYEVLSSASGKSVVVYRGTWVKVVSWLGLTKVPRPTTRSIWRAGSVRIRKAK